ncbi:MAG: CYTH and CHAD domain-containing protein [Candidatus Limnocylindrales bacterium]
MSVEREAKLSAPEEFGLPGLDGLGRGIVASPPTSRQLDAIYYDTEELHLARAGVTLRHRTGESGPGWTLKLPQGEDGPALMRRELLFDNAPGEVPAAARDLVRVNLRARLLVPVVRLRTDRTAVELRDASGQAVAEVVDDAVKVYDGERLVRRFREIEVEVRTEDRQGAKVLRRTVDRLVDAGCRADSPVPKAIRALGPRAQAAPEVAVPDIGADATMGLIVVHAFARSAAQIVRHDPGVRLGDDPEDVHQLRVGARHLRSDLHTFAALLAPDWVSGLRAELAWLGVEVGVVRDADVLAERLLCQVAMLPEQDSAPAAALLQHLADQRAMGRAAMLESLRSPRYDALVDALVQAANRPPFSDDRADRPACRLVVGVVRRSWRRLARAVDALADDPPDDALHHVRILAKRCRYAAEAAAPAAGQRATRFAAAVADVQTVLGDHQDAIVAESWLRAAASTASDTGIAAGELVAVQRHERARLRKVWPATWETASAGKLRTWLRD